MDEGSGASEAFNVNFTKLEALIEKLEKSKIRNEAQTRLEIIDTLLYECLGWSKYQDVSVEEKVHDGYADYILSCPRKSVVVEAKKEGAYFDLPKESKPSLVNLKALTQNNKPLAEAIKQVKRYAQDSGIPLAIVTNGRQLVAFIAIRNDGESPDQGKGLSYHSLEQIKENFADFWNYFSREGVSKHNLTHTLLARSTSKSPPKPSAHLTHYPGIHRRNELQTDLMILADLVLEDLAHDDLEQPFLEMCYCESGALSQYALLARNIIGNKYPQNDDETKLELSAIKNKKGLSPEFLSTALTRRPIILLGDVGVGKTTFIRRLIKVDSKDIIGRGIALHLDLGEKAILSDNVKDGIVNEIERLLVDDYEIDIHEDSFVRRVYKKELAQFSHGIYKALTGEAFQLKEIERLEELTKDRQRHLVSSLNTLGEKGKKSVVIFLDNADQRSTADQQDVFLAAQELASQTTATVFVSLRPETFYLSTQEGVLQAYHPRAFSIDPPRIDLVLQKRLQFSLKLATGEIQVPKLQGHANLKLDNLTTLLTVMIHTLDSQQGRRKELITFIENIAAGNVRQALEMVKEFISNGHVNTKKILELQERGEEYVVPFHEFLKAIIYYDKRHYDPSTSPIANVFDVSGDDPKEYFLKLVLLHELASMGTTATATKGFVPTGEIYSVLQSVGYIPEQVDTAIVYCMKNGLIETSINVTTDKRTPVPQKIRITTKGACYTKLLATKFQYIDAIAVDTPIFDDDLRHELIASYESEETETKHKVSRSEKFVKYLEDIYTNELRSKAPKTMYTFLDNIFSEFHAGVDYIKRRIEEQQEAPISTIEEG